MSATQRLPGTRSWIPSIKVVKPAHIMLIAGSAVVLTHMVLGLSLVRQSKQEKTLKEDAVVAARSAQNLLSVDLDETQRDLLSAEARLVVSRGAIPARSYTTEFVSDLLGIARFHSLEVVSLESLGAKEQIVGVHKYQATPVTIVVRGAKEDITGFASSLEETNYPLLIRSAQFEINGDVYDMTVDFDVYSRSSDEPVKTQVPASKPAGGKKLP